MDLASWPAPCTCQSSARRDSRAEPWSRGSALCLCPGRDSSMTLEASETGHTKSAQLPPPRSLLRA